jgi:DNA-binding MarR family transcriptional regulator
MSLLSSDLLKLPPQALDVLRYLDTHDDQGTVDEIIEGTGLSKRGLRKAIRRLVTRFYAEMPDQDFYRLTEKGKEAAGELRAYDGENVPVAAPAEVDAPPAAPEVDDVPAAAPAAPPADEAAPAAEELRHVRRMSMLVPKELVIRSAVTLRAGFDAPPADDPAPLKEAGRVLLRLSAPGCDVEPVERPLDVAVDGPAGPVSFRVTPRREGAVRVKVSAYQLVSLKDIRPIGGMFFDLNVAGFPTPDSAEVSAVGAVMRLYA